jgi:hypothetical protein
MRRIVISLVLVAAIAGVAAAPAQATFHLNMVNEVMLASASGDPGVQFVEFLDNGGTEEQFTPVFAPYKLIVYDTAGKEVGEQTLDPNGLRAAAAADREYLVSTAAADSAFGVSGNERLTVTLPAAGGQVCFAGNEPAPKPVNCMGYGTVTKPVATNSEGTGSVHGPIPPNGQSDQRQPDGSVIAALPTPKARNRSAGPGPKPTAGAPTLAHVTMTATARGMVSLGFTALAGSGAPGLDKISVALPGGLSFDSRRLAESVRVSGSGGAPVKFSDHLRAGKLAIKLGGAQRKASVAISRGIVVSKALARKLKHHTRQLTFAVTITDASGKTTRLVARVRVG